MSKHTPGPWAIKYGRIVGPEGQKLTGLCDASFDQSRNIANARLIAAAPDLLAALQALINTAPDPCGFSESLPHYWQALGDAQAAIAKATQEDKS